MSETTGKTIIEGQNLFLYKQKGSDWNTPVMLGCLTGLTFKLDSEAIEVMCDANGNLPENIYGKQNGTLSISGVYKKYSTAEQADNFGGDELQIAQETKSFINLQWGTILPGDTVKRANVMITSYQETHQNSQVSTYTAELKINGGISRATIPN